MFFGFVVWSSINEPLWSDINFYVKKNYVLASASDRSGTLQWRASRHEEYSG
jgi:hypothetical protein